MFLQIAYVELAYSVTATYDKKRRERLELALESRKCPNNCCKESDFSLASWLQLTGIGRPARSLLRNETTNRLEWASTSATLR